MKVLKYITYPLISASFLVICDFLYDYPPAFFLMIMDFKVSQIIAPYLVGSAVVSR